MALLLAGGAEVTLSSLGSTGGGSWGNKVTEEEPSRATQEKAEPRRTSSALSAKAPWAKDAAPATTAGVRRGEEQHAEEKAGPSAPPGAGWRQAGSLAQRGMSGASTGKLLKGGGGRQGGRARTTCCWRGRQEHTR